MQEDQGLPGQMQLVQARGPRSPMSNATDLSKRTKVSQFKCSWLKQDDQGIPGQLQLTLGGPGSPRPTAELQMYPGGPRSPRPNAVVSSKRTEVSHVNCSCLKQKDQGLPGQLQLSLGGPRSPRPTAAVSWRTNVSHVNCSCLRKQKDQGLPCQLCTAVSESKMTNVNRRL